METSPVEGEMEHFIRDIDFDDEFDDVVDAQVSTVVSCSFYTESKTVMKIYDFLP